MSGLQGFEPDSPLCIHCHAPAAGRCAGCHATVCADCCELGTLGTRPAVYCKACIASGASTGHRRALRSVVVLLLVVLAAALAVAVLVHFAAPLRAPTPPG